MPLRQSRLNFSHRLSGASTNVLPTENPSTKHSLAQHRIPARVDADTIVVDTSELNTQLPTPSESAADASSQGSGPEHGDVLPATKSTSVVNVRKSKFREESVDGPEPTGRSVSGETLVNKTSQSSLLKSGIKALDLDWDMDSTNATDEARGTSDEAVADLIEANASAATRQDESEDERERIERIAARKAKMEQTAKKWEQRRKAAEKQATRRSGRASLVIEKAGGVISGLASGVLGKRARDSGDDGDKVGNKSRRVTVDGGEMVTKKSQFGEEKPLPPLPKRLPASKDKRWLTSGLYAGQTRTFDARLTESSNKKKHNNVEAARTPAKENKVIPLPMFAGERLLQQGREFKLPFDIFCPVTPGQAKPAGWRKQNRNVFIGDAFDCWRFKREKEFSTCICTRDTGCDHNCLNRTMYYECDKSNCNLPYAVCGNRQWSDLASRMKLNMAYATGVDVIKTADRGHGVRANRTFEPGQIILEYTGEIITQEECERRMRVDYKNNDVSGIQLPSSPPKANVQQCYYLMLFDQNMILDATKGSMARFVNHSCEPNCSMEKWTVNGDPRMALFAGERGITTGEELTYDYNFDPYSQKNVQQCYCGSKNCRGFLGPRPKDVKPKIPDVDGNKKKSEGRIAGAKRKVAEVLGESTSRLNKKQKTEAISTSKTGGKGSSPKKVVAVKKVTKKKVTLIKAKKQNSTLKKIIIDTKKKTTSMKAKRIVSTGSMKEALIPKAGKKTMQPPTASSSLRKKAATLKNTMVNSMKGRMK